MSIIADALKKAEQSSRNAKDAKRPVTQPKKPVIKIEPAARTKKRFFLGAGKFKFEALRPVLYIGIVLTAFVFAGFLSAYLLRRNPSERPRATPSPGVPFSDTAIGGEQKESSSYAMFPEQVVQKTKTPPLTLPAVVTLTEVNEAIRLNGIMYTAEAPLAVINNNIWNEGENIGKFIIQEIGEDFVRISARGQEFVIRLKR